MSRVGVVLPVRDDGARARTAVKSILRQTWKDWQLIIVDDGSVTPLVTHMADLVDEPRITFMRHNSPLGISPSINAGVALLDCEYIARLDSDDFSHPERLTRQVDRLARDTSVVALGTRAHVLLEERDSAVRTRGAPILCPVTPAGTRTRLMWGNPLVHSSVMMRASALDAVGGYRHSDQVGFPEDLDLWIRLSEFGDLANLDQALHVYRRRHGSVTDMTGHAMGKQTVYLVRGYWNRLLAHGDQTDDVDTDALVRLLVTAEMARPPLRTARCISLIKRAFDRATQAGSSDEARREFARMAQRVVRLNLRAQIT